MKILAIETSCDETAAAVVENGRKVLSNIVSSQANLHAKFGGVVPEIASRRHIENISAVVYAAVEGSGIKKENLDAVAVTYAPGLIGALLAGGSFAKAYAYGLGLPLIPVHHMKGHIAANYLAFPELKPPFACLVASGGHTLFTRVDGYDDVKILGQSRDDAAGEAFDKVARLLGLSYPGGKKLDELSRSADKTKKSLSFPRPVFPDAPLDCSFSGLKTAVINALHTAEQKGAPLDRALVARSFNEAVCDILVPRAISLATENSLSTLAVAGGVAANSMLRERLSRQAKTAGLKLCLPPLEFCGDNAAMIGAAAFFAAQNGVRGGLDLNAFATLPL